MDCSCNCTEPTFTFSTFISDSPNLTNFNFTTDPGLNQLNATAIGIGTESEIQVQVNSTIAGVILLLITIPLVLATILGNSLIIISWIITPSLRTPSNGYLLSLAIVDLLTGLVTMPLGIIYDYNRRWIFGPYRSLCQLQLLGSYGLSLVGSLHLIQIAVDRYRILFQGVSYLQRQNLKKVLEFSIISWLIALWVTSPILLDWENIAVDPELKMHCVAKKSFIWVTSSFLPIFILPMFLLARIYYAIYSELKEKHRKMIDFRESETLSGSGSSGDILAGNGNTRTILGGMKAKVLKKGAQNQNQNQNQGPGSKLESESEVSLTMDADADVVEDVKRRKMEHIVKMERKSAATLAILIGAFYICWTPYVALSLLKVAGVVNPPNDLFYMCAILGFVNSTVNPIIYAVRNQNFRRAFKRILCIGRCR